MVLMLFVALLVTGIVSYPRIPLQLAPAGLSMGNLAVYIPIPDATPRDVMERVAKPCEEYLRTVPGVRQVISSSGPQRCFLRVAFSPELDPRVVVTEVRDRLERARASWIEGADDYFIWRHRDSDMPLYIAAVSLGVEENEVDFDYLFEDVIEKRLLAVDGVARVQIWGLLEKSVEIGLDPNRVDAHRVDLRKLITRLRGDNQSISVGKVDDGDRELLVQIDGRFTDFDDVREFPVNEMFRLSDIASVGYEYSIRDRAARANGAPSRTLAIYKDSSANTVEVCESIRAAMQELKETLPKVAAGVGPVSTLVWFDQGEMIQFSVGSLQESGLWGGVFAAVVLYVFFRRFSVTLLVTLAIPFSLLITVIWVFFRGGTFNIVCLMGFTLGIGMLVDNSIVVVENIVRKRDSGFDPVRATIEGVKEVGLAVTLATLTTVMVFLPLLFIPDPRFKVISTEIGGPVCISVLGSLLVALVFIPQGAFRLLTKRRAGDETAGGADSVRDSVQLTDSDHEDADCDLESSRNLTQPRYSMCNRAFVSVVRWCLENRVEACLLSLALLLLGWFLYGRLSKQPLPPEGPRRLEVNVELPKNFSISEADESFAEIEAAILAHKEQLNVRSVNCWFRRSGGEVNIFLLKGTRVKEEEFFKELRPLLPRRPGITYRFGFEDFTRSQSRGGRVRVFVRGNNIDDLEGIARRVEDELKDQRLFPEVREVARWRDEERAELRVHVLRSIVEEQQLDTTDVSRAVAWALRGASLADFVTPEREYPFWIRYGKMVKDSLADLRSVRVFRADGNMILLENLIEPASVTAGIGDIHRINGKMTIGFSARTEGEAHAVRARLQRHFRRVPVPAGTEISLRDDGPSFAEDAGTASAALAMAFSLVFFLMGILFESFILPLSILCVIPFAIFGSIIMLWATGVTFDMVGMIGILILVGIVVNNAIVLVDLVNRLRRAGMERGEALVQAVQTRFRPIWMTALTTICGLMPLLLFPQQGEGIDYKPLAVVLVGGLSTSTFFTLFMVPVFYSLFDDLRKFFARREGQIDQGLAL